VFEEKGKTIFQPIVREQSTHAINELFQRNMLEVWLPNGQSDFAQFDISILKYKQINQPSKLCRKAKTKRRLRNRFETIISGELCPPSQRRSRDPKVKENSQPPNVPLQLQSIASVQHNRVRPKN